MYLYYVLILRAYTTYFKLNVHYLEHTNREIRSWSQCNVIRRFNSAEIHGTQETERVSE